MDTYETLHAGDVILGGDDQEWGVVAVSRVGGQLAVALTRFGQTVTGYPLPGTAVTVLSRADTIEEMRAFFVLEQAFGETEVVGETWTV